MSYRVLQVVATAIALVATTGVASAQGTMTKAPYRFTVDNLGLLRGIESPVGTGHSSSFFSSGYTLCVPSGTLPESVMSPVSIIQPNGPDTLPLSVVVGRNAWEITWTYTVDPKENELLLTAKVKNLSGAAGAAQLRTTLQLDPAGHPDTYTDVTHRAVWQRAPEAPEVGFAFSAVTNGFAVEEDSVWAGRITGQPCDTSGGTIGPFPTFGDANPTLIYNLGTIGNNKTKTVAFQLRRF